MNRSITHSQELASRSQTDDVDATTSPVHKPAGLGKVQSELALCCYHNQKSKVQVVRSFSSAEAFWHLERVVFPGQRLMFYAPVKAMIKVYTGNFAESLLSDTIPCDRLVVDGE